MTKLHINFGQATHMNSSWSALPHHWQVAFEAAANAYLQGGSVPVGAVVTSASGQILAIGRNAFRERRLAHAELDAINQLSTEVPGQDCRLYVTVEPCPMCTGAIRMAQIAQVSFAACDPAAGFTQQLALGEFMNAVPCQAVKPINVDLEHAIVALVVEHRERTGHQRWRDKWAAYHPQAFELGVRLARSGAHAHWLRQGIPAEQLFAALSAERDDA